MFDFIKFLILQIAGGFIGLSFGALLIIGWCWFDNKIMFWEFWGNYTKIACAVLIMSILIFIGANYV